MNHPDPMDNATETEEFFRRQALAHRAPPPPPETGFCLNCGEPTAGRWCDSDCRDDWDSRMHLKRINGWLL